jgi:hypothetical protein
MLLTFGEVLCETVLGVSGGEGQIYVYGSLLGFLNKFLTVKEKNRITSSVLNTSLRWQWKSF